MEHRTAIQNLFHSQDRTPIAPLHELGSFCKREKPSRHCETLCVGCIMKQRAGNMTQSGGCGKLECL